MLVDTNVWSELLRREPLPAAVHLLSERRDELVLSTVVVAEMEFGIAKARDMQRRDLLRRFLDNLVQRNAGRILPPTLAAAATFGLIKARLRSAGTPIADLDLMIASQAIAADMPLVTRNVSDMERTGAVIINPWSA